MNASELSRLSQAELQVRCAWCHRVMPEDEERFGAGAKVNPAGKRMVEGREGSLTTLVAPEGHHIFALKDEKPNKAPEPTTTAGTSPAAQEPRQP